MNGNVRAVDPLTALTVGHSNHALEHFLALLASAGVEGVADVRSQPYSRYAPQFNKESLAGALSAAGRSYAFHGAELGGRPQGDAYYDDDGHVLYDRVAGASFFRAGLDQLVASLARQRVALMCSEEDPTDCHRRLLVARVLLGKGVEVLHLRGDGRLQHDHELNGVQQGDLFSGFEEKVWRSTRSVSPVRARLASLTS